MFISIVVGHRHRLRRLPALPLPGGARARVLADRSPAPDGRAGRPGMLLGALTATGAFFVLMLTDFQGIREFGFVAGTAILMAFLSMVTLFPALLALVDRRRAAIAAGAGAGRGRGAGDAGSSASPRIARRSGADACRPDRVRRLERHPRRLRLQHAQAPGQGGGVRAVGGADPRQGGTLGLHRARDIRRASTSSAKKQEAFAALPTVAKVESVLMLVPDRQAEKVKLIQQFAPLVAPVRVGTATAARGRRLRAPLETLRRRLRLVTAEGGDKARREVRAGPGQAGRAPRQARPAGIPAGRTRARAAPGADRARLRRQAHELPEEPDPATGRARRAPPELRHRYIGSSGRYLLRIHPAVDIWQQAGAERFVTDLRRGDPDVTGPPITSLRGHSLHPARLLPGHAVRARARDRRDRGDPQERPRHGARADAARPGGPVDARLHARLRPRFQPRQCVGAAADHRHGGRVRAQYLRAVPGGPRDGGARAGAEHRDGRRPQRPHDHGGVRQPDGRASPGHLRPRTAPDGRHGRQPLRIGHRFARAAADLLWTGGARRGPTATPCPGPRRRRCS